MRSNPGASRRAQNNAAGVIALGGGAWTLPGNRNLIASASGTSVWLDAPFNLCWAEDRGRQRGWH
ncbi:MAG: hypothetical protein H0W28_07985 [Pyrinomonadaceae bacterium]|nr:hypothetical protein [Pyrinomonadaceae bacterium]